jgi:heptosyltransferase-2
MKTIKNILVIRFRRVGDAVLSSSLCTTLKKTFPDARIDYVLNAEIAPLFEQHPDIDRIITFRKEEMKDRLAYLKKVRRIMKDGHYDIIVDTRSTVKTLWFSLFSPKTPYRLGTKKAYNFFIHNYRTNRNINDDEVGRTLTLLRPLEKRFDVKYDRNFKLYLSEKEKSDFKEKMEEWGLDFSGPIMVCAVTARLTCKVWDMERMRDMLLKILENFDIQLVFNYGGKEEEAAAKSLAAAMNHPLVFDNIEAKTIRELAALIANSDFFFGNEGGPRHISQALDVPSFAIYPPNISKKDWLPNPSDRFQGIEPAEISAKADSPDYSYREKFELITVDEVWKRIEPMLEKYF